MGLLSKGRPTMSSRKKLKMVASNIEVAAGKPAAPDPEVRGVAKRRQFGAAFMLSMLAQGDGLTESGAIGRYFDASGCTVRIWRRGSAGAEFGPAKRGTAHGSRLGKTRWVVERSIACLYQIRWLRIRYERRPSIHEAFLKLGRALICRRVVGA